MLKAGVITASDRGAAGQREDVSGPLAMEMLKEAGYETAAYAVVPDDRAALSAKMIEMCDAGITLIVTTGGTGFAPRDVTPEATRDIIEREVPGIPQAMMQYSLQITPRAMLSRAAAGIRGESLIVNLPGSPKAVRESLECILPSLQHGLEILTGQAGECARKD